MASLSPLPGSPWFRSARFCPLLLLLSGFALAAAAGCGNEGEGLDRRCFRGVTAYIPQNPSRTCGGPISLDLELCEVKTGPTCATTEPTIVCLSSPGDNGFLVQLSPCAELLSLPSGWANGEEYVAGVNAVADCKKASTRCSDGAVLWTPAAATSTRGGTGGHGEPGTLRIVKFRVRTISRTVPECGGIDEEKRHVATVP